MVDIISVKYIRRLSFYDWNLSEQENIKKWIDLKIAKPFPSRDNIFNMHILVGSTEAQKRMGLIPSGPFPAPKGLNLDDPDFNKQFNDLTKSPTFSEKHKDEISLLIMTLITAPMIYFLVVHLLSKHH